MARKKINKKKTYEEFMAWLEGVESMQDADWVPNDSQWKTIREMLDNIKIEPQIITKEVPVQQAPAPMYYPPIETLPAPAVNTPPPQPPATSTFEPSPQKRQMPSGITGKGGVPAANSTKRSEVLDTSDGNYTSEFL